MSNNPIEQAAQTVAAAGEDILAEVLHGLARQWGGMPRPYRSRLRRKVAALSRAVREKHEVLEAMRSTLNQGQHFDFGQVRDSARVYYAATAAFWETLADLSGDRLLLGRLLDMKAHFAAKAENWEKLCDEAEAGLEQAAEAGAEIYGELGLT